MEKTVPSQSRPLTVSEILDGRPLSRFQARTIALCTLVLVLDGFDAQCIGFLAPSIAESQHIPLKTFGPIFAAGLFGLMIASMAVGPIADRWGRRWTSIASTLAFAAFAASTAHADTFNQFLVLRFLTGLGLGGAMPNMVALTSEYSPRRLHSVFVTALFCGMPLGALIASLASKLMIPAWGWRSVFYLGGILPLLIGLALVLVLPESVRFLAVRSSDPRPISAILARISPELATVPLDLSYARKSGRGGVPVKHLFTEGRAYSTVLLWIAFFMGLLIIYFIVNWLPGLLRQSGMPISVGVTAITAFSLGGIIASVIQGRIMNAFGDTATLLAEFALTTIVIAALAFSASTIWLMLLLTFLVGGLVQGAQAGLNAISAAFYPTSIRSTGVGWALGVGRAGSIVGPLLGGVLLSMDWQPSQIVLAGALPALLGTVAIFLSHRRRPRAPSYRLEPDSAAP